MLLDIGFSVYVKNIFEIIIDVPMLIVIFLIFIAARNVCILKIIIFFVNILKITKFISFINHLTFY